MSGRLVWVVLAWLSGTALVGDVAGQAILAPGVWVTGALEPSDPRDDRGRVHDRYVLPSGFEGLARITVESEAFDPTVRVEAPLGEVVQILGESDDAPDLAHPTDALAFAEVEPGQVPVVLVRSWDGRAAGGYRIRIDPLPLMKPRAESVSYGADVHGALEETDAWVNGVFEDRFRFEGEAGERVRVLVQSKDFDVALEVWGPTRGQLVAQDDDGFEVDDAWVEVALPASGTYEIRVRPSPALPPSRRVMLGAYRLRMGPGLLVEPDPTLGGLALTHEERMGLRSDAREIRHDALRFSFPAPAGRFAVLNVAVEAPELVDPLTQLWHVIHQATGDELVVMAMHVAEPVTEAQLHRVGKRWFEAIGGTLLEERMDLDGTRSVTLLIAQPSVPDRAMEVRCRTSAPDRIPGVLVCLWDGGSYQKSIAGLEVW
jgi:hypothetical protein